MRVQSIRTADGPRRLLAELAHCRRDEPAPHLLNTLLAGDAQFHHQRAVLHSERRPEVAIDRSQLAAVE